MGGGGVNISMKKTVTMLLKDCRFQISGDDLE